jgi:uncharacterized protein
MPARGHSFEDNPDLARTGYAASLAALPEELRRAYRDGDVSVGIRDTDFQVIPTAWVLAAEARRIPARIAACCSSPRGNSWAVLPVIQ